ncbi:hypothetical protein PMAYCL1PPCAC_30577, partial [Pristionchus mayeri]
PVRHSATFFALPHSKHLSFLPHSSLIRMAHFVLVLLLAIGTAIALECFVSKEDGETVVSSDPTWSLCGMMYVEGGNPTLFGLSESIERLTPYENLLVNSPMYKVKSTCFNEEHDFSALGSRWASKEETTRCVCRGNLCNGHKTISSFLGIRG